MERGIRGESKRWLVLHTENRPHRGKEALLGFLVNPLRSQPPSRCKQREVEVERKGQGFDHEEIFSDSSLESKFLERQEGQNGQERQNNRLKTFLPFLTFLSFLPSFFPVISLPALVEYSYSARSDPFRTVLTMLHALRPNKGSTKNRHRVARGNGAGSGTTAGRGGKGQKGRTGKGLRLGFEGGQTPLIRRQPKLGGFVHPRRVTMEPLNLDILEKRLQAGTYDLAALKAHRVISGRGPVKLLGRGTVTKKISITVNAASKSAKAAIEKAGGSVTIVA